MLINKLETLLENICNSDKIFHSKNGACTAPTCDEIFVITSSSKSLNLLSILYMITLKDDIFAVEFSLSDFEIEEQTIRNPPKTSLNSFVNISNPFQNFIGKHSYTYLFAYNSCVVIFSEHDVIIYEYVSESLNNEYIKIIQRKYVITKNKITDLLKIYSPF